MAWLAKAKDMVPLLERLRSVEESYGLLRERVNELERATIVHSTNTRPLIVGPYPYQRHTDTPYAVPINTVVQDLLDLAEMKIVVEDVPSKRDIRLEPK